MRAAIFDRCSIENALYDEVHSVRAVRLGIADISLVNKEPIRVYFIQK